MRYLLRQTRPTWLVAEQSQLSLGDSLFTAWALIGQESNRMRYVIEAGDTIVYVDSRGIPATQVIELLSQFAQAKQ
jgi:hypothetical protein